MLKHIAAACGRGALAFARVIPDLIRDAIGIAGVGLISYGAWLIYEPSGFIVAGCLLLIGTIAASIGRKAG